MSEQPPIYSNGGQKPVSRRVRSLCRRHLRMIAKGKSYFDQATVALQLARNAGLRVGQAVEVEQFKETGEKELVPFELIDNTVLMEIKGAIYRPARVPKYELKEIPKTRRSDVADKRAPKPDSQPSTINAQPSPK